MWGSSVVFVFMSPDFTIIKRWRLECISSISLDSRSAQVDLLTYSAERTKWRIESPKSVVPQWVHRESQHGRLFATVMASALQVRLSNNILDWDTWPFFSGEFVWSNTNVVRESLAPCLLSFNPKVFSCIKVRTLCQEVKFLPTHPCPYWLGFVCWCTVMLEQKRVIPKCTHKSQSWRCVTMGSEMFPAPSTLLLYEHLTVNYLVVSSEHSSWGLCSPELYLLPESSMENGPQTKSSHILGCTARILWAAQTPRIMSVHGWDFILERTNFFQIH